MAEDEKEEIAVKDLILDILTSEEVQGVAKDLVVEFVEWTKKLFKKKDEKVVKLLESQPRSQETEVAVEAVLKNIAQDDVERTALMSKLQPFVGDAESVAFPGISIKDNVFNFGNIKNQVNAKNINNLTLE